MKCVECGEELRMPLDGVPECDSCTLELLTREYVEELVGAGGAKLMSSSDLSLLASNLVLANFEEPMRGRLATRARTLAERELLPVECRRRRVEVDVETAARLKHALGPRDDR